MFVLGFVCFVCVFVGFFGFVSSLGFFWPTMNSGFKLWRHVLEIHAEYNLTGRSTDIDILATPLTPLLPRDFALSIH